MELERDINQNVMTGSHLEFEDMDNMSSSSRKRIFWNSDDEELSSYEIQGAKECRTEEFVQGESKFWGKTENFTGG